MSDNMLIAGVILVAASCWIPSASAWTLSQPFPLRQPHIMWTTTTTRPFFTQQKFQTSTTLLHASKSFSGDQALEVFCSVAQKDLSQDIPYPLPTIDVDQLSEMLKQLDIDASAEETIALFRYLDVDEDGQVTFDEFLPWYNSAAQAAQDSSAAFQDLLISRRTVDNFDDSPVDIDVLRRAVQCAIAAPNRSGSEPWRFIKLGKETVEKLVELVDKKNDLNMEENRNADNVMSLWREIPGWVVVTTRITPDDPLVELEDFQSTSCAVQNLMLSMWSEGVGSKWTSGPVQRTKEFANICGVDLEKEKVAGVIWYGFPQGGLKNADPKRRKKGVDDVLSSLP
jgi:nitroreductase